MVFYHACIADDIKAIQLTLKNEFHPDETTIYEMLLQKKYGNDDEIRTLDC